MNFERTQIMVGQRLAVVHADITDEKGVSRPEALATIRTPFEMCTRKPPAETAVEVPRPLIDLNIPEDVTSL